MGCPVPRERSSRNQHPLRAHGQGLCEFTEADISTHFRADGSTDPDDDSYQALAQSGFKGWRLQVAGLVAASAAVASQAVLRDFDKVRKMRTDLPDASSVIMAAAAHFRRFRRD